MDPESQQASALTCVGALQEAGAGGRDRGKGLGIE